MPEEGLTVAEIGKVLREHAEPALRAEWTQIVEVVLLAVATVLTAWSGYAAAKWSTESRLDLAHASSARIEANRAAGLAATNRNYDSSTFGAWFTAYAAEDAQKMQLAERRFRPAFAVAFDAWWATRPATNPNAPRGPLFMPQYRQPEKAEAARLDARADRLTLSGEDAGVTGDRYVRTTLFLAAVLFLVGIGTTLKLPRIRTALVLAECALLLAAVVVVVRQPVPH